MAASDTFAYCDRCIRLRWGVLRRTGSTILMPNVTLEPRGGMRVFHKHLRETHIVGSDTPEKIIAPRVSPLMHTFHIGLVGVSDAGKGFTMARLNPNYGHIVACFSGRGEVLVDGEWKVCTPGSAYLTPPNAPHA